MIVIDASVAIKWVVREPHHEMALAIIDKPWTRIAPDLLLPEVANVLRKKQRLCEITDEQVSSGLSGIKVAISRFVPSTELVDDAAILSRELDHSAYDCFYLACALSRGVLVSADKQFVQKCQASGYAQNVASVDEVGHDGLDARIALTSVSTEALARIERLTANVEKTFESLKMAALSSSPGQRFKIVDSTIYRPAFDSPAYRRLGDELKKMSTESLGTLVALGWLGRDYHSIDDWPGLFQQACLMTVEGFEKHRAYFVAQMARVPAGLAKLNNCLRSDTDN